MGLAQLLHEQNENFKNRESNVDALNETLVDAVLNADTKDKAMRILLNFRTQYDMIRLM